MSSLPIKNWLEQLRDLVCSPYAIIAICGLMGYVAYTKTRRHHVTYDEEDYQKEGQTKQPVPLKGLRLTRRQLAEYNSKRADKTYLVALQGVIYDVSSGAHDFGPGCKYALLSGTELTDYIRKQSRVKGRGYEESLNDWRMMLEDIFYPAGKLIDDEKNTTDTAMNPIPEEIEEKEQVQEEKDLELGSQDLSTSDEDTCSDGDSHCTDFGGSKGEDDRAEVDREEDRSRDGIDFSNENDATLIAAP